MTFRFENIEDLKLEAWNHQNVLYELHLKGPSDAEAPVPDLSVRWKPRVRAPRLVLLFIDGGRQGRASCLM